MKTNPFTRRRGLLAALLSSSFILHHSSFLPAATPIKDARLTGTGEQTGGTFTIQTGVVWTWASGSTLTVASGATLNVSAGTFTLADAQIGWAKVAKSGSSLADLATRSATDLSSGTLPDARFPATLPAISGVNLTALDASDLASGTVPDARFPATLPAASGVNLTALNGSNVASGTVAAARLGLMTGDGGSGGAKGAVPAPATGDATKFLRGDGTWADAATSGLSDPTTTKGDLITRNASAVTRLGVGSNDQVLTADSTQATGLKWATPSGGWVHLSSQTASASAQIDFVLSGSYVDYLIVIDHLKPATDDTEFTLRFSQDGGSTFVSSASSYRYNVFTVSSSTNIVRSSGATELLFNSTTALWGQGNDTVEYGGIEITLIRPRTTTGPKPVLARSQMVFSDGTSGQTTVSGAFILNNDACDAVRLYYQSGNIATGRLRLFGRVGD